MNTTQVMWSYVDLVGFGTNLTTTTNASTGVSTLQVYTSQPGYYSCEVTEDGGMSRVYTVLILTSLYTGRLFCTLVHLSHKIVAKYFC